MLLLLLRRRLLPGLIKRIFRFLLLQLLLLHHFALTAQRIRLRGPDRQRTHTAAADEVAVAVHAHINHVFRHRQHQRRWRLVRQIALVNRHRAAGAVQFGRLVIVATHPGDGHLTTVDAGEPGIDVIVGGPGFPRQMQARILRPQLTPRTALHHLLHSPQRHVGRLGRHRALRLRIALVEHSAIFGNH